MAPSRLTVLLLLLGSLLVGLAHVALLPPFEGFDETAHYSYIQQLAETGRWPARNDKMSKDIDDYLAVAPTAEAMQGPWTYHVFFSAGPDVRARGRQAVHARPPQPREWTPGQVGNWQAQHPPLYYLAMAPAYLISKGWSLGAQLFFLRSLSYLFAWAGLCILIVAALRITVLDQCAATVLPLAVAAWPAIFPMWFPEMGRIGNDSLITVFAACTFLLIYRMTRSTVTLLHHTMLGITLGLALLTKATFLPVAAAAFVMLTIMTIAARRSHEQATSRFWGLCLCAVIVISLSGWWYLLKLLETGSVIGSNDAVNLSASTGLIAGLKALRLEQIMRMPWELGLSFVWAGTWSFVLPPRIFVLPFVAISAGISFGLIRHLQRSTFQPITGYALLVLGFFTAAIAYHSLVLLILIGNSAPAWYLHSLAPILALLLGYGIAGAMGVTGLRYVMSALLLYPLAFLAAVTAMNILYFAGCAPKLPSRLYFSLDSGIECLRDYPRILDNLSYLAFPYLGIALFAVGWLAIAIGLGMAVRSMRASSLLGAHSIRP